MINSDGRTERSDERREEASTARTSSLTEGWEQELEELFPVLLEYIRKDYPFRNADRQLTAFIQSEISKAHEQGRQAGRLENVELAREELLSHKLAVEKEALFNASKAYKDGVQKERERLKELIEGMKKPKSKEVTGSPEWCSDDGWNAALEAIKSKLNN